MINFSLIAQEITNKKWQPVLDYTLELHKKCTYPAAYPFEYEWEEIGIGYSYGPAFGHWDIVHQVLDALVYDSDHALKQLYNNIKNQEPTGMIPGSIWLPGDRNPDRKEAKWSKEDEGHPPVWVVAVDDYVAQTGNKSVLKDFYAALIRQISWFENNRRANGEGFFYNDIVKRRWESGVDMGVRFDEANLGPQACIDATSHVYSLYKHANKWGKELGVKSDFYNKRENELKTFINDSLFDAKTGSYFDSWSVKDKSKQHFVLENFWPMMVGAISKERADFIIDEYLMNPKHFLSEHPITTVSMSDPKFELRMWRGPAWNSMTYWAARACIKYGRYDAAKILLKRALDSTANQFNKTGKIWEFYHPNSGNQKDVKRKSHNKPNMPCPDYLGHNPLWAMYKLYEEIKTR